MSNSNDMIYNLQGSGGSHMVPSWSRVWELCDESPAVRSYDEGTHEIVWCDGSTSVPTGPHEALNEIRAMEAC